MKNTKFVSGKTRRHIEDISATAKRLDPETVRRAFKARAAGSSEGRPIVRKLTQHGTNPTP
jgi:hypothetical protein